MKSRESAAIYRQIVRRSKVYWAYWAYWVSQREENTRSLHTWATGNLRYIDFCSPCVYISAKQARSNRILQIRPKWAYNDTVLIAIEWIAIAWVNGVQLCANTIKASSVLSMRRTQYVHNKFRQPSIGTHFRIYLFIKANSKTHLML